MSNTRKNAAHPALPPASVLDGWKVKNNSPPFDEDAAIRYLERTRGAFAKSVDRILESAFGSVASPKE